MTEPVPVRTIKAARITRAAEVVETVEITEYASGSPAGRQELESGDRESTTQLVNTRKNHSGAWLEGGPVKPRRALPPGSPTPARPRWWGWWR